MIGLFGKKNKEKKIVKLEDLNPEIAREIKETFRAIEMNVVDLIEYPDGEIYYTLVVDVCAANASISRFEYVRKFEKKIPGIKVKPVTIGDYVNWLKGFIKMGGEITHEYDYPMTNVLEDWFVAEEDFVMRPLHGAESVYIIVPRGIKYLGTKENLGHSTLYFEDGYTSLTGDFIPSFTEVRSLLNAI